ncbi:hypothetical protein CPB97_002873 [Podila verticillata]|nr:hypothetical protein CPB97_002873 [Podila verticillata]
MTIRIFRRNAVLCVLTILILITFHRTVKYAYIDIGYLTRPIWDQQLAKFKTIIPHYHADGMSMKARCEAHGWTLPTDPNRVKPRIFDALLFSVELDMLEIRMHELWDVVDHFVIMESNMTFTGLPKELTFAKNRDRFAFAESKILYKNFVFPLIETESAWDREGRTRDGMTALFLELGLTPNDMFTSVDVDELIYPHTLELIKSCEGVPNEMHLELKNYLYSFEFPTGETIWETAITRWYPGVRYIRHQSSDIILTDAGWHCSFCFKYIKDFQFKIAAYSHSDRVRYAYTNTATWIQKTICEGRDLFGMLPEAYTYKELFRRMGQIPKATSAVGLPRFLQENKEKYKFMLPGGCVREDGPEKF